MSVTRMLALLSRVCVCGVYGCAYGVQATSTRMGLAHHKHIRTHGALGPWEGGPTILMDVRATCQTARWRHGDTWRPTPMRSPCLLQTAVHFRKVGTTY
jgi:hypothetical protein